MKPGLSTLIPVQDCLSQDYCLKECIASVLPVSDEVVIADWKSTDGTLAFLQEWAEREPRLRIVQYPAEEPRGLPEYNLRWMNYARERLSHAMMLHLDADEILDDTYGCHATIRNTVYEGSGCRTFNRLNFWRDPLSLIPDGHYLGRYVTRLGPSNYWLPCDEPRHPGESRLRDESQYHPDLRLFHMGFLRKPEAFYSKAKRILIRKFNRYDQALEFAERDGKPQWESEQDFSDKLEPYEGDYPALAKVWLAEHGFTV